jgi:tetratricopeptide (TPR) repeat protein
MRMMRPAALAIAGAATVLAASGAAAQTDPEAARRLIAEGNADLKAHDYDAAISAFTRAVAADPHSISSFNLCVTYYNIGRADAALPACDQAIAANPAKADAYFVKGSLLVADAKVVNGKLVAPPGAVEALNKYLELAPDGPHAKDTRDMLDYLK